ncbi:hypothetical protein GLOTRDRAFT_130263 [Gloeophyllum trabeum ATCC 11539]|uniref:Protein kinase domain-containing protein n=1 Tax=Gloeophyllum trabeum (strain ATCC 11539 / FP-39264 / Madison 617) TaxID=670483 RepID=S7Q4H6_GLOTA|nr:uncharacterized protein GLOTRDRAFT_130263 [Gloeophyllum trabeum ATCC 11539]EPQ54921.1 hypothetical protein GLOTRDRAFT_130263 [Gloeophyllum trabeum ATCC 11539]
MSSLTDDDLDFLSVDSDELRPDFASELDHWRPRRYIFMYNVVREACAHSPDQTPSTWLRIIEGSEDEDTMTIWAEGDEAAIAWEAVEAEPYDLWKDAQDALRRRYDRLHDRRLKTPCQPTSDPVMQRIWGAPAPGLRAGAIAWNILCSAAVRRADAQRGLRCRPRFFLGDLVRIWVAASLSDVSYDIVPGAYARFVARMQEAGHRCHERLGDELKHWVPFMCWLHGTGELGMQDLDPSTCEACYSRVYQNSGVGTWQDDEEALFELRQHPLLPQSTHGGAQVPPPVLPALLVTLFCRGASGNTRPVLSIDRAELMGVLECVFHFLSSRLREDALREFREILWKCLCEAEPDPAYAPWINVYPPAWRPYLSLLSAWDWEELVQLEQGCLFRGPYAGKARLAWRRTVEHTSCFPASRRLLAAAADAGAGGAGGRATDVQTVMAALVWLLQDYALGPTADRPSEHWKRVFAGWVRTCGWLEDAFVVPPLEGMEGHQVLSRIAESGHTCYVPVTIREPQYADVYGRVLMLLHPPESRGIEPLQAERGPGVGYRPAVGFFLQQSASADATGRSDDPDDADNATFSEDWDNRWGYEVMACSACIELCSGQPAVHRTSHVARRRSAPPLLNDVMFLHVRFRSPLSIPEIFSSFNIHPDVEGYVMDSVQRILGSAASSMRYNLIKAWAILMHLLLRSKYLKGDTNWRALSYDMVNTFRVVRACLVENTIRGMHSRTESPAESLEASFIDFLDIPLVVLQTASGRLRFPSCQQCALTPEFRKSLLRIVTKISEDLELLPRRLFLGGIRVKKSKPLSGGGFADVYKGYTSSDYPVVLKRLRVYMLSKLERKSYEKSFRKEVILWSQLWHPFVQPFLGIDERTFKSEMCMVSPRQRNGNLKDYLQCHPLPARDIHSLLHEIAQGLAYLHGENIVHGDLKAENILVDDGGHPRLTDFGLSVLAEATRGAFSTSREGGSAPFNAPELFPTNGEDVQCFRRTVSSDIWAFGCVCVQVCTGKRPFPDIPEGVIGFKLRAGYYPLESPEGSAMTDELWELMKQCWRFDPSQRICSEHLVDETGKIFRSTSIASQKPHEVSGDASWSGPMSVAA